MTIWELPIVETYEIKSQGKQCIPWSQIVARDVLHRAEITALNKAILRKNHSIKSLKARLAEIRQDYKNLAQDYDELSDDFDALYNMKRDENE